MPRPIHLTSEGLSNTHVGTWRYRGQLHATVTAEVGFRVASDGSLVIDPTVTSSLEGGTLQLPHAEIIVVGGPCGWLRTWRGQAVRVDKTGAGGLGPLPDFAPARIERLRGRGAPHGDAPHVPDDFDFAFFQLTPQDQWLDHLAPGDVVAMYDPQVQHPLLTITVPDEVVSVSGGHTATLAADRLFVDLNQRHVVLGFHGSFAVDEGTPWSLHVARGEGRPSRRGASQPPPDAPPVDATMGFALPTGDAATPFGPSSVPASRPGISFAELRQQSEAPVVPADAVDATLGLGFTGAAGVVPPPSAPAPVAPASAPTSPSLPGAPVEPVMVGEVAAPPRALETVAAPEVAGDLDIQLTAIPAAPEEPTASPAPPSAPKTTPTSSAAAGGAKKTKKKDVRNALLRKMRRK